MFVKIHENVLKPSFPLIFLDHEPSICLQVLFNIVCFWKQKQHSVWTPCGPFLSFSLVLPDFSEIDAHYLFDRLVKILAVVQIM